MMTRTLNLLFKRQTKGSSFLLQALIDFPCSMLSKQEAPLSLACAYEEDNLAPSVPAQSEDSVPFPGEPLVTRQGMGSAQMRELMPSSR